MLCSGLPALEYATGMPSATTEPACAGTWCNARIGIVGLLPGGQARTRLPG